MPTSSKGRGNGAAAPPPAPYSRIASRALEHENLLVAEATKLAPQGRAADRKEAASLPSLMTMRPQRSEHVHEQDRHEQIPQKGDRIELLLPRLGIRPRGTVFYADELQVLVKWDDGRSESLRPHVADRFRVIDSE